MPIVYTLPGGKLPSAIKVPLQTLYFSSGDEILDLDQYVLLKSAADVTGILSERSQQVNTLILEVNDLMGVLDQRRWPAVAAAEDAEGPGGERRPEDGRQQRRHENGRPEAAGRRCRGGPHLRADCGRARPSSGGSPGLGQWWS